MSSTLILKHGTHEFTATVRKDGRIRIDDRDLTAVTHPDGSVRFVELPGVTAWAISAGDIRWVFLDGQVFEFEVRGQAARRKGGGPPSPGLPPPPELRRTSRRASHHGSLTAPMPATVRRINVAVGDRVKPGDTLIILEAMKMELPVKAASAGTIESINCHEGELVQPGAALIDLEED